jgi:hypothetical protein
VPEKLAESLRQSTPPAPSGGMTPEEGLKSQINEMSLAFPEEALEKGKSWPSQSKIPVPGVGTVVLDRLFTFRGPDAAAPDLRLISMDSKVRLEPAAESNLSVKINAAQGKGEYTFDPQGGRIVSSRNTDTMQMSLAVQGQDVEQTTQTITTLTLTK